MKTFKFSPEKGHQPPPLSQKKIIREGALFYLKVLEKILNPSKILS